MLENAQENTKARCFKQDVAELRGPAPKAPS